MNVTGQVSNPATIDIVNTGMGADGSEGARTVRKMKTAREGHQRDALDASFITSGSS
jgi:chemotaxis response regulator CheB